MKRTAIALLAAVLATTEAQAAPIAGVNKALAEAQQEAKLEAPIAGASRAAMDALTEEEKAVKYTYSSESTLNPRNGVFYGPSGKESYYNLPMRQVVRYMRDLGNTDPYWVREDGVKMLGDYVMVAADLDIRPKGTILPTSLGDAIVCDTGTFADTCPTGLDVAVAW